MNFAAKVKKNLFSIIDEMDKHPELYVNNPGKDFTRRRKLSLSTLLKCMISMEGSSIRQELFNFFDYQTDTPSASAFVQQRKKITLDAFYHIFHSFNQCIPKTKKYHGYTLIACDGSVFNLPINLLNEKEKYKYFRRVNQADFYQMHLDAFYDLMNQTYTDICISPRKGINERNKFIEMLKRGTFDSKTIFVADRGYEGFNVVGAIHDKNFKYVIRAKDSSVGGIVKGFKLPKEGEYDVTFTRLFTYRKNNEVMQHPEIYYKMHYNKNVEFVTPENPYRKMTIRILRIKVEEDKYECIITNLLKEEFSADLIKEIYKLRWGIETSFRELKYRIGLKELHSKTVQLIEQEIMIKLIIYNFCGIIATKALTHKKTKKHTYKINKNTAMYLCVNFLRSKKTRGAPNIIALIEKELLPIRPGRNFKRRQIMASPINFLYRAI